MLINGQQMRSVWWQNGVHLIDQRKLPQTLEIFEATTIDEVAFAINNMVVRGAPAIGATAAYGMALGGRESTRAARMLRKTRPTAQDLFYAIDWMTIQIDAGVHPVSAAETYVNDLVDRCKRIGEMGNRVIEKGDRILTHCNAGALATVDWGTALAPIRMGKQKDLFVWVDETRPRLQGYLTSWELTQEGISHAVIADNAAGYFMAQGDVDLVLVGADRIARNGDVANKIGTYEKAVLAHEHHIPFYVAAPRSTIDLGTPTGRDIPIEERDAEEMTRIQGRTMRGTPVRNPAFDVTPASYITGIITEEGILTPTEIATLKKH